MGRRRKIDKKVILNASITPYTMEKMNKFIEDGKRSIFVENAILEKLKRMK